MRESCGAAPLTLGRPFAVDALPYGPPVRLHKGGSKREMIGWYRPVGGTCVIQLS